MKPKTDNLIDCRDLPVWQGDHPRRQPSAWVPHCLPNTYGFDYECLRRGIPRQDLQEKATR